MEIHEYINLLVTVVGLGFVLISLKQTRRSINAATYQHILDREAENWTKVRNSSKVVKAQALENFGIEVDEKSYGAQHDIILDHIDVFNFYEGVYFHNLQKTLNKEIRDNWKRSLKSTMSLAKFNENWQKIINNSNAYSPGFRKYMESILND